MKNYDFSVVELVREKTTASYDEIIETLNRLDGDVALVLAHFEKNGKLRAGNDAKNTTKTKMKDGLNNLLRRRIVITKDNYTIANISLLFVAVTTLLAFWVVIVAFIACMFLGYKVKLKTMDIFSVDTIASEAKQNFKDSVSKVKNVVKGDDE